MNFMQRGLDFVVSYSAWVAAGRPLRDPAEVSDHYDVCKTCPAFLPNERNEFYRIGLCGECRCHVSDDYRDSLNMLAIPQKACPLQNWEAVAEHEDTLHLRQGR